MPMAADQAYPPLSKIEPERHLNPSADQQEPANLSTLYKDREYK